MKGTRSWTLKVSFDEIGLEVPENLRDMIEAQIEDVRVETQGILEAASVNGVQFSGGVSAGAASCAAPAGADSFS